MNKALLLLLIITASLNAQIPFGDSIMPVGAYSSKKACWSYFTNGRLDTMSHELGFNQHMSGGFTTEALDKFIELDIYPQPWDTQVREDTMDIQIVLAHSTYFITHPETDSSRHYYTKFATADACSSVYTDSAGYLKCGGKTTMLEKLQLRLNNRFYFTQQLLYYPVLRLSIDTTGTDINDVVGIFKVRRWNNDRDGWDLRFTDSIKVSELPRGALFHDTTLILSNDYDTTYLARGQKYFSVEDDESSDASKLIRFDFETTGKCTVYVDYFEVYDQLGKSLMDNVYDNNIKESVSRGGYKNKILGWFLKDTMRPQNYRPFAHVDSLIRQAMIEQDWTYKSRGSSWMSHTYMGMYREFVRIGGQQTFWVFLYPLYKDTRYTGSGGSPLGLQSALNDSLAAPCDTIRSLIDDFDYLTGWLYTPQAWFCETADCGNEPRRKPTRSEMLCMTYIGMCYHPESILYWKLDSKGTDYGNQGIFTYEGLPQADIYDAITYDINPYIKAIDSTYLNLTWNDAYTVNPDFGVPGGKMITALEAYSRPDTANPDLGWFQVGEFHDDSYDKYFMLVNRACNRDSLGNEAPRVLASVRIDRNMIDSDFAYVIDLARGTGIDDWTGYPDTTLTAVLADGTIPYTTVFKAGEGRLFKVVPADF